MRGVSVIIGMARNLYRKIFKYDHEICNENDRKGSFKFTFAWCISIMIVC